MFEGFPERLHKELVALLPSTLRVKVIASPIRKYYGWLGASIVGSLSCYNKYWVTKQLYEDNGGGVFRKMLRKGDKGIVD